MDRRNDKTDSTGNRGTDSLTKMVMYKLFYVLGEGEGVPALRQVRVPAKEVVHAGYRLHLQPMDQVRDQGRCSSLTLSIIVIYVVRPSQRSRMVF